MSSPYVGEIRMFGGNFAPAGWLFCDGSLLPISENEALFALIGTNYGGDGQTTFALPDLRGRVPIHSGQGFVLGETAGSEMVTLTVGQMPSHVHPSASSSTATLGNAAEHVLGSGSAVIYSANSPSIDYPSQALLPVGGSQTHNNMMPYLGITFIISLFGIFPSPN